MTKILSTNTTESIVAFITGGIPASIVSLHFMEEMLFPVVLAGLTGLIGGIFALLGKDVYKWVKSKLLKNEAN